jgi:hypothetical protein
MPNETIGKYLRQNFTKVEYNNIKIQNLFSTVCGHYVITFIYFMSLGFEFPNIINIFKQYKFPDRFVLYFFNLINQTF